MKVEVAQERETLEATDEEWQRLEYVLQCLLPPTRIERLPDGRTRYIWEPGAKWA